MCMYHQVCISIVPHHTCTHLTPCTGTINSPICNACTCMGSQFAHNDYTGQDYPSKTIQGGEICKSRVRDSLSNPSRDTFLLTPNVLSHQFTLHSDLHTHTHTNYKELYNHSLLTEALKNSQDMAAACYNIMQP